MEKLLPIPRLPLPFFGLYYAQVNSHCKLSQIQGGRVLCRSAALEIQFWVLVKVHILASFFNTILNKKALRSVKKLLTFSYFNINFNIKSIFDCCCRAKAKLVYKPLVLLHSRNGHVFHCILLMCHKLQQQMVWALISGTAVHPPKTFLNCRDNRCIIP